MTETTTGTGTNRPQCKHENGWYVRVHFWIFSKRVFVCSDCGHHQDMKVKT